MRAGSSNQVLPGLRRAVLLENGGGLSDGQLLEGFVRQRDEAAFEALVRRHGPMVLGVCRRVIGHESDAEDAFQAAFLVLVRRAASIVPREKVGNWLYGVAYRTALEARKTMLRRRNKEKPLHDVLDPETPSNAGQDLAELLDRELSRLPDKYRLPLVLCAPLASQCHGSYCRQSRRRLGPDYCLGFR
jgi:RNA polymerase sigma-70 factor (ECF subfamily)